MNRFKLVNGFMILFLAISLFSCDNYGKKLEFNAGEVYYTSGIKESEAKRLGIFLVNEGFFDGVPKSVQVNKKENIYEVKFIIQTKFAVDSDLLTEFKRFTYTLSVNVFEGIDVEIDLCDESFDKVIASVSSK